MVTMMVKIEIGSARIDEHGNIIGGLAGDQKQVGTPDYKGEVSMQNFYVSSKGWIVLRAIKISDAYKIADNMVRACNNPNVGYNQNKRNDIIKAGTGSAVPTSCDCSSLVRQCVREAGIEVASFTTATEVKALMATGAFTKEEYVPGYKLFRGDILVTKTKGHTVVVVNGNLYETAIAEANKPVLKDNEVVALEVIQGKWGNGATRRTKLTEAGYNYRTIQVIVNKLVKGKGV